MKNRSSVELKHEKDVLWRPSYSWYLKTSVIILGLLIVTFFTLNILLKQYMRQIDRELTPWLNNENTNKVATE
jgi:hypothetical protein